MSFLSPGAADWTHTQWTRRKIQRGDFENKIEYDFTFYDNTEFNTEAVFA